MWDMIYRIILDGGIENIWGRIKKEYTPLIHIRKIWNSSKSFTQNLYVSYNDMSEYIFFNFLKFTYINNTLIQTRLILEFWSFNEIVLNDMILFK